MPSDAVGQPGPGIPGLMTTFRLIFLVLPSLLVLGCEPPEERRALEEAIAGQILTPVPEMALYLPNVLGVEFRPSGLYAVRRGAARPRPQIASLRELRGIVNHYQAEAGRIIVALHLTAETPMDHVYATLRELSASTNVIILVNAPAPHCSQWLHWPHGEWSGVMVIVDSTSNLPGIEAECRIVGPDYSPPWLRDVTEPAA